MDVCVIIPVYNHQDRVADVIHGVLELGLPVIVVDDGSTDQTPAVLASIQGISVIRHPVNQGKGAALLTGFAKAQESFSWAITIDADGQHRPDDARAFLEIAGSGRRVLAVGNRQGMSGEHVPWTSRFGRGFSNFWVWASGGPWLADSQSGFRLYPLPESSNLNVTARRYQFEVEILVKARRKGLGIVEVPVSVVYQPKGVRVSHFRPWRDFLRNSATFSRLIFTRFIPGNGGEKRSDFYKLLVASANVLGPWLFAVVSRIVAVGFFLTPGRIKESRRFYALLFPSKGRLYHLFCTFRQFQNFTTIHYDRYLGNKGRATTFTAEGQEQLESILGRSGAILLMSHFGNWEMAARLLMRQRRELRLLLYMGIKEKEGVEKTQKEELRRSGVRIIGADQNGGSPFAVVDGIRLLKEGGIVSMTGDIVWQKGQRCLPVSFLGGTAYLPETPFVFSMVSGAPIYVFFAFRLGTNSYQFTFSEPITVTATARDERKKAIADAAQRYADLLGEALRRHPLEWYHFDRFVHFPDGPGP
jgi:predicted LPLAT superfamily acyltransferase